MTTHGPIGNPTWFGGAVLMTVPVAIVCFCAGVARSENFCVPQFGNLFIQFDGGSAGANSEFGLGTTPENHQAFLAGLPNNPSETSEVLLGTFAAGEVVKFSMKTGWGGTYWAFSNDNFTTHPATYEAFYDRDNSLGWNGNIIESLGNNLWRMNLDDAASSDDDDNDFRVRLRLEPLAPSSRYPDANKTGNDGSLCWAATAANLLQYQGWASEAGFRTEQQTFDYFKANWPNAGGWTDVGLEWFISGSGRNVPDSGGAFFPSLRSGIQVFPEGSLGQTSRSADAMPQAMDTISTILDRGQPVGLCVYHEATLLGLPEEWHAFTCWEYEFEPENPSGEQLRLLISDSDTEKNPPRNTWVNVYKDGDYWTIQNNADLLLGFSVRAWRILEVDTIGKFPGWGSVRNGGFSTADLSGWIVDGGGMARVVECPEQSGDFVAEIVTGSPETLAQVIDRPESPFHVAFNFQFGTTTGTLQLWLDGVLLSSIVAPEELVDSMTSHDVLVVDPGLLGHTDSELTFVLDGPTNSRVFLDDVAALAVPEPGMVVLLGIGTVALAGTLARGVRRRAARMAPR